MTSIKTPEELASWAEEEHNKQLDRMSGVDEEMLDDAMKIKVEEDFTSGDEEENYEKR